jgi:hypothetical protein
MAMKHKLVLAGAIGALALLANACPTTAGETRGRMETTAGSAERAKYRKGYKRVRVYGYSARRGGYSYNYADVVNTYGQSRTLYGGINTYRDPFLDRQTSSGPFDHDFFFDSGIGPRGGDSPYLR